MTPQSLESTLKHQAQWSKTWIINTSITIPTLLLKLRTIYSFYRELKRFTVLALLKHGAKNTDYGQTFQNSQYLQEFIFIKFKVLVPFIHGKLQINTCYLVFWVFSKMMMISITFSGPSVWTIVILFSHYRVCSVKISSTSASQRETKHCYGWQKFVTHMWNLQLLYLVIPFPFYSIFWPILEGCEQHKTEHYCPIYTTSLKPIRAQFRPSLDHLTMLSLVPTNIYI